MVKTKKMARGKKEREKEREGEGTGGQRREVTIKGKRTCTGA